ncbi:MAG: hypothetical protein KDE08_07240, partial [Rhodobacteraceae bacterium]|nr:hypothetical protein [Paracoccaceae bacterium]
MTALQEYQRLECTGLWRESPDAQRREVIVSFGDATLVIADAKNARALAHWSLPAVQRLNPGERPAIFAPGPEEGEDLEIEDEALIKAIGKVHTIIEARRPHPGRLRTLLLATVLICLFALGFFWMPTALIRHTAGALPPAKVRDIGLASLTDLSRLTGPPCTTPEGRAALDRMGERLLGGGGRLFILPNALSGAVALPGGIVALGRDVIETGPTPDLAAGHVVAAALARDRTDPTLAALRFAGFRASVDLLTTGNLPDGALFGYGEALLTRARPDLPLPELQARFAAAGVSAAAYSQAMNLPQDTE